MSPLRARRYRGARTSVALLALALSIQPAAARQRLELRHVAVPLPGAPASIIPADLNGDGLGDLVIVVAYTEWDRVSFEEAVEIDPVEGLVEVMTVVPALFDRRELLVLLGTPEGGFEPVGDALPLDTSVLAVERGAGREAVLALTDGGVSALRATESGEVELAPLLDYRTVLGGSGALLPNLGLTRDVDGDGERDLLLPGEDHLAVFVVESGALPRSPSHLVPLPPRRPRSERLGARHYALPEIADVDADGRPDLLFRHPQRGWGSFYVARARGDGFETPVAAHGEERWQRVAIYDHEDDWADDDWTHEPSWSTQPYAGEGEERDQRPQMEARIGGGVGEEAGGEGTPGEETGEDAGSSAGAVYFGDIDGDGRAEYVVEHSLQDPDAGFRKEMKQAKVPRFTYRVHGAGEDLAMQPEARMEFPVTGYGFPGGEGELQLPGGFRDLDGDGRQDLVTITLEFSMLQLVRIMAARSLSIGMDFHVYCQRGSGRLERVAGLDLSGKFKLDLDDLRLRQLSQFAGDFDGDGRADFVQMGRGRDVTIHLGREGCSYAPNPDLTVKLEEEPRNLALVRVDDLDGDGLADLVVIQPQRSERDGATRPVRLDLYLSAGAE